jgi:hypothetical protein
MRLDDCQRGNHTRSVTPSAEALVPALVAATSGRNENSSGMTMMKANDTITLVEGYEAMHVFLEAVWRRHDKPVEEIAFVLAGLKWADGSPVDPTMWQDWLAAAHVATAGRHETAQRR